MTAPGASARALPVAVTAALGAAMLAHVGFLVAIKLGQGLNHELWWLSHIGLAVAAGGLLLRSHALRNAALIALLWPHGIWLFDSAIGLLTQRFPLGLTGYLATADATTWIATAHHFYLLPVLVLLFARERRFSWDSLVIAAALLIVLTVSSRAALPATMNINMSHRLLANVEAPLIRWTDTLSGSAYLALINTWVILLFFLPAAMVLHRWSGRSVDTPAEGTASPSHPAPSAVT